MAPEVSLRPSVGEVENMYTGIKGVMCAASPAANTRTTAFQGSRNARCMHEKRDEVIPYQESVENFERQGPACIGWRAATIDFQHRICREKQSELQNE